MKNKKNTRLKNRKNSKLKNKKDFVSRPQVFKIHDNLCSVQLASDKFSNKLKSLDGTEECGIVNSIFSVNGKSFDEESNYKIPFEIDENTRLRIESRHVRIMNENKVYNSEQMIFKCTYEDKVAKMLGDKSKGLTRIII